MRYRTFGKEGWQVSEIGFGAMHLAGMEEREAVKLLLKAFERGINFVDTAAAYGVSEEIVGKALREWRGNDVYVATKLKPVEWPLPSEPDPSFADRYPAAYIRSECEASLRRLGTDTIDLYQLHGWFPRGLEETEWYETLLGLVQQGKIRQIGVSLRDYRPEEGLAVARSGRIVSEQVVFNLFEQRPADELFPVCRENGVAVIARVPFDEGALTGAWDAGTYERFDPNDFRRTYFKGNRFLVTLEKVERIKRPLSVSGGSGAAFLLVRLEGELRHTGHEQVERSGSQSEGGGRGRAAGGTADASAGVQMAPQFLESEC